ncbi:hypothetical protein [Streptacidiphilus carbonis]|uniref:hypothetical protein n=1 Tax=Streptacidiphilus carbonis TaxID=105422 RepID=UPI0005AA503D|nr:hypothetical protein [Streptacidiphilus carbonis]
MRADPRRIGLLAGALTTVQLGFVYLAGMASAAPSPSPKPSASVNCNGLIGPGKAICEQGNSNVTNPVTSTLDPLQSLANGCSTAAAWVVRKLSDGINSTTNVDFTNPTFLKQYAVVFAASTFLTLIFWLLAVAKRAVRGVPIHTAIGEAIGFLWLTVIASAFTPLVLYTVVSATDGITAAIASGTKTDTTNYLGTFADTLTGGNLGGGPIIQVMVSLVAILAAAVLWLEMLIRAAMLYVGALLGTAVYAGLVDRQLWKHVRRWAGLMVAVDLIKPVIVIILGLAGAIASNAGANDAFSTVLAGLAILALSIFASTAIYRFVPGFGDDMAAMRQARASAVSAGSAVVNGPANFMKQGINTHAGRESEGGGQGGARSGGGAGGGSVTPGIAAHGSRGPRGGAAPAPPAQNKGGVSDRAPAGTGNSSMSKGARP